MLVLTRGANVARYAVQPWKKLRPLPVASFIPGMQRHSWDWSTVAPGRNHVMVTKNVQDGSVNFLDDDNPGVTLFRLRD